MADTRTQASSDGTGDRLARETGLASLRQVFSGHAALFAWFLIFAFATRFHALGDLNYHEDELLFFYIGQRMHDGLLPYVDIWDRKPPSLFLIYYLIAGVSRAVLAYQIIAALFAAGTAFCIARLSELYAGRWSGLLAGSLYLALTVLFAGGGGQAAIFMNLPMALAALLVVARRDRLRQGLVDPSIFIAMALAGFAITIKQTAIFEAAFLGLFVLFQCNRNQTSVMRFMRTGFLLALIGALPMLLWAVFYLWQGHFAEFWHAMVTANLDKQYGSDARPLERMGIFAVLLLPLLLPSAYSFFVRTSPDKPFSKLRPFVAGWTVAAFIGFAIIPNLIEHYALPLLVPLCVSLAPLLQRGLTGTAAGIGLTLLYLAMGPALNLTHGQQSRTETANLVAAMRKQDPAMRLLVYDGPVYLYALTGSHPPTPLVFPLHLFFQAESNVSHLDTVEEFRKLIAMKPTTVVTRVRDKPANLYNRTTHEMVKDYIARHCAQNFSRTLHDMYGEVKLVVHTQCANGTAINSAE